MSEIMRLRAVVSQEDTAVYDGAIDVAELSRSQLWDIDSSFKCPVIGMCLDTLEVKKILQREGYAVKNRDDFELHEIIVQHTDDQNHISRRVDGWLDRKFKKQIEEFSHLEETDFMQVWKEAVERGDIEGLLWVAVTKPDLSITAMRGIFGDVHMAMNLNARRNMKERQELISSREKSKDLVQKLHEVRDRNRLLQRENESLRTELTEVSRAADLLEKEKKSLELKLSTLQGNDTLDALRMQNNHLQSELKELSEKIRDYKTKLKIVERQNARLRTDFDKQCKRNKCLRTNLQSLIGRIARSERLDEASPAFNLSKRRVLVVGGMLGMEVFYRQLVEDHGGVFEYNNGYAKGGLRRLEQQLKRSDLILCLIDHNSHAASSAVKTMGKKYQKPVKVVTNSSLNRILQSLFEFCELNGTPQI
jgi:DNA repair exonuclease SbcCD ATPase subunit